jgi:hypothetical protein
VDPADGTMTNWNNTSARGWGAADNYWGNGSVHRVDLLNENLERLKGNDGKWGLAAVTSAMNAAATQDVRAIDTVPLLQRLLVPAGAPSQQTLQMRSLLIDWRQKGGSRLDKNLDGKIDHAGAAIMDAAWPRIADAVMMSQLGPQLDELDSLFSRYDQPPRGQEDGWHQYFDRDVRDLLGMPVAQPLSQNYCGRGDLGRCRRVVWNALRAAGAELTAEQGTPNAAAWRADATGERISFVPGLLPTTMRYSNRPSGIQQVISFNGHG